MTWRIGIHVRYSDSDKMGIVHHGAYVRWLEAGRVELMRASGLPYDRVEERGYAFPVLSLNLRYRKAARFDERLELETRYEEVGRTRVRFAYRLRNARGEIVAEGTTEHACLDERHRPCRIPAWLREGLRPPATEGPGPELH